MIIGKSLTALGGGGLKPEIIVTAKAGASLNLHYKDSTIILQSYQLGAEEIQHTFVVDVSETVYVVEDVTNSKSVEVLVDAVAQYNAEIIYVLWLYRDGDECEDITGGWQSRARGDFDHISNQLPTFIKNTSNFTVSIDSGTGVYSGSIETIKDIDLTKYSTLYVSCVSGQAYQWSAVIAWACSRTVDKIFNDFAASVELVAGDGTNTTKYINNVVKSRDISEITGLYDIAVSVDGKSQVTIDKIWLE